MQQLVMRMISNMHQDFSALNILSAGVELKLIDHIPQIINLIEMLIDRGHAYVTNEQT